MRRLAPWGLLLLAACASDTTQLVVVVDGDLVPAQVRVDVEWDAAGEPVRTQRIFDTSRLPLSFGIAPLDGAPERFVRIQAHALDGNGTVLVTGSARTSFIEDESRVVTIFLSAQCQGVVCPAGQTCGQRGCVSETLDPSALPRLPPGSEFADVGVIPVDAGVPPDASRVDEDDAGVEDVADIPDGPGDASDVDPGPTDTGGFTDGPIVDLGGDAGTAEAGVRDSGVADDSGVVADSGVADDTGGTLDAQAPDAQAPDAQAPDSQLLDSGVADTGPPDDVLDTGVPDDAGLDAGATDGSLGTNDAGVATCRALTMPTNQPTVVATAAIGHAVESILVTDLDGNGRDEIVASDGNSQLTVLDDDCRQYRTVTHTGTALSPRMWARANMLGPRIAVLEQGRLRVLTYANNTLTTQMGPDLGITTRFNSSPDGLHGLLFFDRGQGSEFVIWTYGGVMPGAGRGFPFTLPPARSVAGYVAGAVPRFISQAAGRLAVLTPTGGAPTGTAVNGLINHTEPSAIVRPVIAPMGVIVADIVQSNNLGLRLRLCILDDAGAPANSRCSYTRITDFNGRAILVSRRAGGFEYYALWYTSSGMGNCRVTLNTAGIPVCSTPRYASIPNGVAPTTIEPVTGYINDNADPDLVVLTPAGAMFFVDAISFATIGNNLRLNTTVRATPAYVPGYFRRYGIERDAVIVVDAAGSVAIIALPLRLNDPANEGVWSQEGGDEFRSGNL